MARDFFRMYLRFGLNNWLLKAQRRRQMAACAIVSSLYFNHLMSHKRASVGTDKIPSPPGAAMR